MMSGWVNGFQRSLKMTLVCMRNFLFILLTWTQKNQMPIAIGIKDWARRMRTGWFHHSVNSCWALTASHFAPGFVFSQFAFMSVYEYYNPSFIPLAENAIPLIPCLRWRPARLEQVILSICRFRNKWIELISRYGSLAAQPALRNRRVEALGCCHF